MNVSSKNLIEMMPQVVHVIADQVFERRRLDSVALDSNAISSRLCLSRDFVSTLSGMTENTWRRCRL